MDEPNDRNSPRFLAGLLLLLGSPGIFAGLALTLLGGLPSIGLRSGHPTSSVIVFGFLGLAAAASGVGGCLARPKVAPEATPRQAASLSIIVGMVVYLATLVAGGALFLQR